MEALRSGIRHDADVGGTGRTARVPVTDLVPGDLVWLRIGALVPADLRLVNVEELECDEGVLTGESLPVAKSAAPVADPPAAGPAGVRLHGDGRPPGERHRRGGPHRHGHRLRADRRRAVREPGADGVRGGPVALLPVPVRRGRRPDGLHLHRQRGAVAPADRRAAVLAGHRRGHRPRDDAGHRDGQPVGRFEGAGRQAGPGEAARGHRGPRQHRGPLHRQDGHAHRRGHHLRAVRGPLRPRRATARSCSAWCATRRRPPAAARSGATPWTWRCGGRPSAAGGARSPLRPPPTTGSPSSRSTTSASWCPSWSGSRPGRPSWSPRAPPRWCWTAAPTSPRVHGRRSRRASPKGPGWWPWPRARSGSAPHSVRRTSTA